MSSESFEPSRLTAPFSVADVFVYIIPGAVLLVSVFFTEQFLKEHAQMANVQFTTPFGQMLWTWGMQVVAEPSLLYAVALLLVLITVTFVAGHLVSSMSSFFIDRLLVHHGLQYPYVMFLGRREFDLQQKRHKFFKPYRAKEAYYRGLFSWPAAGAFFWYCTPWYRNSGPRIDGIWPLRLWLSGRETHLGMLAPLAAGYCFAAASLLIAAKVAWHFARKSDWLKRRYDRNRKLLMTAASGLYDMFHNAFSSVLSAVREPLIGGLLEKYNKCFEEEFELKPDEVGSLHFWLPYNYVMQYAPDLYRLLLMWHHQYEMARNLATSFFLAAVYSAWLILYRIPPGEIPPAWMTDSVFWLPLIFAIASTIMLSRYYYIYVCYFNRSLFRGFVFVHQQRQKHPDAFVHGTAAGN